MSHPVCVVAGAGPGLGQSLAARFAAAGYRVAIIARNRERLQAMAEEIEQASAFACDIADPEAVAATFAKIADDLGPVDTLLYNAGAGAFGAVDDISREAFAEAWQTNAGGLFDSARAVLPGMRAAGHGNLIVTGATASKKGGAHFAGFAAAKAAQYSLTQSLARKLGPEGIHVAIAIVDGVIDMTRTREAMPEKSDDFFLAPEAIAEAIFQISQQPSSAWTFELDLRPFAERW